MTSYVPTSSTLYTTSMPWNETETEPNKNITQPPPGSSPSLTDILQLFPDYRASLALGLYGCAVQVAVGTVTNLLTIIVMTRRTMITSSTCFYFALLAVADLMVLYFACLRRLLMVANDHKDVFIQSKWSCRFMDFFSYFAYDLSSWILTAMTIDRFIAIRYPLKAAALCTIRNAAIVVTVIGILSIGKNIHFMFTFTTTEVNTCLPKGEHLAFMDNVWPWLDATLYSFLPFSLLFVFNILIIHSHRMALRRKRSLHACAGALTRGNLAARSMNFNKRLTTMLLVVSFLFMAMTAPKVILFIIRKDVFIFIDSQGRIDFPVIARYSLVSSIFNFLLWTNHSINFFLYCLSGKRFRQEFLRMLTQCLHRKRHTQVFASGQPQRQGQALQQSTSSTRRDSSSSVVSDDVAPTPAQPPTETEDALSRVNRWATVTFNDKRVEQVQ